MNRWISLFLSALLSACSLAPHYERPAMPIPPVYKEAKPWKSTTVIKPMQVGACWWKIYQDPVLDVLEKRLIGANQNLQIALARYDQARAALQVSASRYFPTVNGIFNANREQNSKTTATASEPSLYNNVLVGANLTYEVDLWGKIRNGVKASENRLLASAADMAAIALSLHAELASNYFTLRSNEAAQQIIDRTVIAYQKALALTQRRHKGGVSPIADVDQSVTQLENARVLALETRLQHAQLEQAIAILVGEIPANFTMPRARYPLKSVAVAPILPSELLLRRPDIAAAENRVIAANAEIGVARAAFFPSVNLSGIIGFESQTFSNLLTKPSLFWSLGPLNVFSLTQPVAGMTLFDGGRLIGLLKLAKASYYETVASYRQTVLNAFGEVEDNLVAIRRLDEENQHKLRATQAALNALQQARNRYKGGITTYLDVVVNENIALQAELESIDIKRRQHIASVQLIKALGGGWACAACQLP